MKQQHQNQIASHGPTVKVGPAQPVWMSLRALGALGLGLAILLALGALDAVHAQLGVLRGQSAVISNTWGPFCFFDNASGICSTNSIWFPLGCQDNAGNLSGLLYVGDTTYSVQSPSSVWLVGGTWNRLHLTAKYVSPYQVSTITIDAWVDASTYPFQVSSGTYTWVTDVRNHGILRHYSWSGTCAATLTVVH